jgi:hypothetical protein
MVVRWDIAVGEKLLRRELHDRWGGGRYGGMEPSGKAEAPFLFSQPSVGETFGYKYDGWHDDDTCHYTGDGQGPPSCANVLPSSAMTRAYGKTKNTASTMSHR